MQINYSIQDEIGIIELDNPPYNQLTTPVFLDHNELNEFINKEKLKGVIVKGAKRNFCSGADHTSIKDQIKNPDDFKKSLNQGKKIINTFQSCSIPVVAAVQGSCLGAGLEIAMSCHFVFASKNAMFGFPEAGIQLMPGFSGTVFSKNRLKRKDIIELILSTKLINGEEASKIGLVDQIFPGNALLAQSISYLQTLTVNKPAHLIRTIMQSINNSERLSRDEALKIETENFVKLAKQLDLADTKKL